MRTGRRRTRRRFVRSASLAAALLALLFGAPSARAETTLGTGQLRLVGASFDVEPVAQAVPVGVPAVLRTLFGGDPAGLAQAGLRVSAELSGPGLAAPVTLTTAPGADLRLPALQVRGEYRLEAIRLTDGAGTSVPAAHPVATVVVTDVLVSSITSRVLTPAELADRGIVVDDRNQKAVSFALGLAIQGRTIGIETSCSRMERHGVPGDRSAPHRGGGSAARTVPAAHGRRRAARRFGGHSSSLRGRRFRRGRRRAAPGLRSPRVSRERPLPEPVPLRRPDGPERKPRGLGARAEGRRDDGGPSGECASSRRVDAGGCGRSADSHSPPRTGRRPRHAGRPRRPRRPAGGLGGDGGRGAEGRYARGRLRNRRDARRSREPATPATFGAGPRERRDSRPELRVDVSPPRGRPQGRGVRGEGHRGEHVHGAGERGLPRPSCCEPDGSRPARRAARDRPRRRPGRHPARRRLRRPVPPSRDADGPGRRIGLHVRRGGLRRAALPDRCDERRPAALARFVRLSVLRLRAARAVRRRGDAAGRHRTRPRHGGRDGSGEPRPVRLLRRVGPRARHRARRVGAKGAHRSARSVGRGRRLAPLAREPGRDPGLRPRPPRQLPRTRAGGGRGLQPRGAPPDRGENRLRPGDARRRGRERGAGVPRADAGRACDPDPGVDGSCRSGRTPSAERRADGRGNVRRPRGGDRSPGGALRGAPSSRGARGRRIEPGGASAGIGARGGDRGSANRLGGARRPLPRRAGRLLSRPVRRHPGAGRVPHDDPVDRRSASARAQLFDRRDEGRERVVGQSLPRSRPSPRSRTSTRTRSGRSSRSSSTVPSTRERRPSCISGAFRRRRAGERSWSGWWPGSRPRPTRDSSRSSPAASSAPSARGRRAETSFRPARGRAGAAHSPSPPASPWRGARSRGASSGPTERRCRTSRSASPRRRRTTSPGEASRRRRRRRSPTPAAPSPSTSFAARTASPSASTRSIRLPGPGAGPPARSARTATSSTSTSRCSGGGRCVASSSTERGLASREPSFAAAPRSTRTGARCSARPTGRSSSRRFPWERFSSRPRIRARGSRRGPGHASTPPGPRPT